MQLDVGKIYEGKVTGITKFGAFVELEPGTTGMVHISEVANSFVSEIKDHLTDGQAVKVKVLAVSDDGKISLSIKKAVDNPPPHRNNNSHGGQSSQRRDFGRDSGNRKASYNNGSNSGGNGGNKRYDNRGNQDRSPQTPESAFEDMLSKFKQNSDERMGDLKKIIDNKRKGASRRK